MKFQFYCSTFGHIGSQRIYFRRQVRERSRHRSPILGDQGAYGSFQGKNRPTFLPNPGPSLEAKGLSIQTAFAPLS